MCLLSPSTSSHFCRDSARSLAAAYNDGALPCNCDMSGSTGDACNPAGGQCPCRQHIIGRRCTKCATGYFGFPYCRREWMVPLFFLSPGLVQNIISHLLTLFPSVRVRPPAVRRGDGTLHLPSSDGQTGLRCVRDSDFQLSPFTGLRGLRMLSQWRQRQHEARLWPHHGAVQVGGHLLHARIE